MPHFNTSACLPLWDKSQAVLYTRLPGSMALSYLPLSRHTWQYSSVISPAITVYPWRFLPATRGFVYDKSWLFSVYSLLILHVHFKKLIHLINTLQKVMCQPIVLSSTKPYLLSSSRAVNIA